MGSVICLCHHDDVDNFGADIRIRNEALAKSRRQKLFGSDPDEAAPRLQPGLLKEADALIDLGPELLTCKAEGGKSMLMVAAEMQNKAMIELLYADESGGDQLLEMVDEEGRTVVHAIASLGYLETMEALINLGGEDKGREDRARLITMQDNQGHTCLHAAVIARQFEMAIYLLSLQEGDALASLRNNRGASALDLVSGKQFSEEVIRKIVDVAGISILESRRPKDGGTCLHIAAENNKVSAVKVLLELGGTHLLVIRDNKERTCLHAAARRGCEMTAKQIFKIGAEAAKAVAELITDRYEYARHDDLLDRTLEAVGKLQDETTAQNDDQEVSEERRLAKMNVIAFARDESGSTCLHEAARGGHESLAAFLCSMGGSPLIYMQDAKGAVCMHVASTPGVVNALFQHTEAGDRLLMQSSASWACWQGLSCVHTAAVNGYPHVIQELFKIGGEALLHSCEPGGRNALHLAASSGQVESCRELMRLGKSRMLMKMSNGGDSCAHDATRSRKTDTLKVILQDEECHGSHGSLGEKLACLQNGAGSTCLHLAAEGGDIEACAFLCKVGRDKNILLKDGKGRNRRMAIQIAAEHGYTELVELLNKRGARIAARRRGYLASERAAILDLVDYTIDDRMPSMHAAAAGGHVEVMVALREACIQSPIEAGRRVRIAQREDLYIKKDANGRAVVHTAAEAGQLKVIQLLSMLSTPEAMLAAEEASGRNALWLAARGGHFHVVEKLLTVAHDADGALSSADRNGMTCLHAACESGSQRAVEMIAKAASTESLYRVDSKGRSCVHVAAEHGHARVIDCLYRMRGPGISLFMMLDKRGRTAMGTAAEMGHAAVVESMYKVGTPADQHDADGLAPAHIAAENGRHAVVEVLHKLANGPSLLMLKTRDGETCTALAKRRGHARCLAVLRSYVGVEPGSDDELDSLIEELGLGRASSAPPPVKARDSKAPISIRRNLSDA